MIAYDSTIEGEGEGVVSVIVADFKHFRYFYARLFYIYIFLSVKSISFEKIV